MQGRRALKTGRFGEASYALATPDQRERPKEEEEVRVLEVSQDQGRTTFCISGRIVITSIKYGRQ